MKVFAIASIPSNVAFEDIRKHLRKHRDCNFGSGHVSYQLYYLSTAAAAAAQEEEGSVLK